MILSPKDLAMPRLREIAVRARCPLSCVVRLICMVGFCPLVLFPKNKRNRASRLLKKATLMGYSQDLSFHTISQMSSYAPVESNGHKAQMLLSCAFCLACSPGSSQGCLFGESLLNSEFRPFQKTSKTKHQYDPFFGAISEVCTYALLDCQWQAASFASQFPFQWRVLPPQEKVGTFCNLKSYV